MNIRENPEMSSDLQFILTALDLLDDEDKLRFFQAVLRSVRAMEREQASEN